MGGRFSRFAIRDKPYNSSLQSSNMPAGEEADQLLTPAPHVVVLEKLRDQLCEALALHLSPLVEQLRALSMLPDHVFSTMQGSSDLEYGVTLIINHLQSCSAEEFKLFLRALNAIKQEPLVEDIVCAMEEETEEPYDPSPTPNGKEALRIRVLELEEQLADETAYIQKLRGDIELMQQERRSLEKSVSTLVEKTPDAPMVARQVSIQESLPGGSGGASIRSHDDDDSSVDLETMQKLVKQNAKYQQRCHELQCQLKAKEKELQHSNDQLKEELQEKEEQLKDLKQQLDTERAALKTECAPVTSADKCDGNSQGETKQLEEEIHQRSKVEDELKKRIEDLDREKGKQESYNMVLHGQLQSLEKEFAGLREMLSTATDDSQKKGVEVTKLQKDVDSHLKELECMKTENVRLKDYIQKQCVHLKQAKEEKCTKAEADFSEGQPVLNGLTNGENEAELAAMHERLKNISSEADVLRRENRQLKEDRRKQESYNAELQRQLRSLEEDVRTLLSHAGDISCQKENEAQQLHQDLQQYKEVVDKLEAENVELKKTYEQRKIQLDDLIRTSTDKDQVKEDVIAENGRLKEYIQKQSIHLTAAKEECRAKEQSIEALRKEVEEIDIQKERQDSQISELKKQVHEKHQEIQILLNENSLKNKEEYGCLEEELKAKTAEVASLSQEIKSLQKEKEQTSEQMMHLSQQLQDSNNETKETKTLLASIGNDLLVKVEAELLNKSKTSSGLREEINRLKTDIENQNGEMAHLQKKLEAAETKLQVTSELREENCQLKADINNQREEIVRLQEKLQAEQIELQASSGLQEINSQMKIDKENQREEIGRLQEKLQRAETELQVTSRLQEENCRLETDIKNQREEMVRLQEKLQAELTELQATSGLQEENCRMKRDIENQREEIVLLQEKLQTAYTELQATSGLQDEYCQMKTDIENQRKEMALLQNRLQTETELQVTSGHQEENCQLKTDIKNLREEMARLQNELQTAQNGLQVTSGLQEENYKMKTDLDNQIENMARLQESLQTAEAELQEKSGLQEENCRLKTALENRKEEMARLQEEFQLAKAELQVTTGFKEENCRLKTDLENRSEEMARLQEELQTAQNELQVTSELQEENCRMQTDVENQREELALLQEELQAALTELQASRESVIAKDEENKVCAEPSHEMAALQQSLEASDRACKEAKVLLATKRSEVERLETELKTLKQIHSTSEAAEKLALENSRLLEEGKQHREQVLELQHQMQMDAEKFKRQLSDMAATWEKEKATLVKELHSKDEKMKELETALRSEGKYGVVASPCPGAAHEVNGEKEAMQRLCDEQKNQIAELQEKLISNERACKETQVLLVTKRNEVEQLDNELKRLKQSLRASTEKEAKARTDESVSSQKAKELEENVSSKETEITLLETSICRLKAEINANEEKIQQQIVLITELNEHLRAREDENQQLSIVVGDLKRNLKTMEEQNGKKHDQTIRFKEQEIEQQKALVVELTKQIKMQEKEIQENKSPSEELIQRLQDHENEIKALNASIADMNEQLNRKEQEGEIHRNNAKQLSERIGEKEREVEQQKELISDLQQQNQSKDQQIESELSNTKELKLRLSATEQENSQQRTTIEKLKEDLRDKESVNTEQTDLVKQLTEQVNARHTEKQTEDNRTAELNKLLQAKEDELEKGTRMLNEVQEQLSIKENELREQTTRINDLTEHLQRIKEDSQTQTSFVTELTSQLQAIHKEKHEQDDYVNKMTERLKELETGMQSMLSSQGNKSVQVQKLQDELLAKTTAAEKLALENSRLLEEGKKHRQQVLELQRQMQNGTESFTSQLRDMASTWEKDKATLENELDFRDKRIGELETTLAALEQSQGIEPSNHQDSKRGHSLSPAPSVNVNRLARPDLELDVQAVNPGVGLPSRVVGLADGGALLADWGAKPHRLVRVDKEGQSVGEPHVCASTSVISGVLVHESHVFLLQKDGTVSRCLLDPLGQDILVRKVEARSVRGGEALSKEQLVMVDYAKGDVFLYNMASRRKEIRVRKLNKPTGIACIGSEASPTYVVTEQGAHRLKVYNNRWELQHTIGNYGFGDGQLNGPQCAISTPEGHVLVADYGNSRICEFSASGRFVRHCLTRRDGLQHLQSIFLSYPHLWVVYYDSDRYHAKRFKLYQ